jgi:hypothetical protein
MDDYAPRLSALEPTAKAMFLARVAHMATIAAREAYIPDEGHPDRNFENPDGPMLRDEMLFVHRVTGYMMRVLDHTEGEGQDASVMAMIVEYYRAHRLEAYLADWLAERR